LKRQGDPGETERVLLYGAGIRAQLFLKDRALRIAKNFDGRLIVGFIDDEKMLHFQWVYGQLVLGGLQELPALIERQKINRVIIVAELPPESRSAIQEIAARGGIHLSDWYPTEHNIAVSPARH
jgi:FlaA1/EpsC-like NDP-sugar epimerase